MQIGVDSQRAVENKRIYVIDDDEITRAALQFMLHDENETHEFGTMVAAADKATAWPPDLVLLGGGLLTAKDVTFAARIKKQLTAAKLLLVCDDAQKQITRDGHFEGIDGYIVKPLRMETVRGRVNTALGRQHSLAIPVVRG